MATAQNAAELLQEYDNLTRDLVAVSVQEGAASQAARDLYAARTAWREVVLDVLWAGLEATQEG